MKKKSIFPNCYLNGFGTFDPVTSTFDPVTPKSIWFLCCPGRVCGQFQEGRSRHSQVIDWKRKGYRRTDRPTDMCKAICPFFFKGGQKSLYELLSNNRYFRNIESARLISSDQALILFTSVIFCLLMSCLLQTTIMLCTEPTYILVNTVGAETFTQVNINSSHSNSEK